MYVLCLHNFPTQADCIIFFFFSFLLSVYNILKIVMPKNNSQCKDAKKWPTNANFQTPTSTGRKAEMANANAVFLLMGIHNFFLIHFKRKPEGRLRAPCFMGEQCCCCCLIMPRIPLYLYLIKFDFVKKFK